MPLAGWTVFTTASSANLADGLHLTFTLTKKVSKLIPRRELTYSPILVCFYLATCCLVKDPSLKQYVFGPYIGSKWRRQRSSQSQGFCGRRHIYSHLNGFHLP